MSQFKPKFKEEVGRQITELSDSDTEIFGHLGASANPVQVSTGLNCMPGFYWKQKARS